MIKLNKAFVSENNVEVIVKLRKFEKSYYVIEFEWDNNIGYSYFGSVKKNGSKWEIFTTQDNYWFDYCGVTFKTMTEAIDYIGTNEIECAVF